MKEILKDGWPVCGMSGEVVPSAIWVGVQATLACVLSVFLFVCLFVFPSTHQSVRPLYFPCTTHGQHTEHGAASAWKVSRNIETGHEQEEGYLMCTCLSSCTLHTAGARLQTILLTRFALIGIHTRQCGPRLRQGESAV